MNEAFGDALKLSILSANFAAHRVVAGFSLSGNYSPLSLTELKQGDKNFCLSFLASNSFSVSSVLLFKSSATLMTL